MECVMDKSNPEVSPEYVRQRIIVKRAKRARNAIAHLYGEKVKRPRVRKKRANKSDQASPGVQGPYGL